MFVRLIQKIQNNEGDILFAASVTKEMRYGPEEQFIPWSYDVSVRTDSFGSTLALHVLWAIPAMAVPRTTVQAKLVAFSNSTP